MGRSNTSTIDIGNPQQHLFQNLVKEKKTIEHKITRLKQKYRNRFISPNSYYEQYRILGKKLIKIERKIIREFPHKKLN